MIRRDAKGRVLAGSRLNPKPTGRPKGSLSDALRKLAYETPENSDKPRNQLLAELAWKKALEGDKHMMLAIYDRLDGKPKQQLDIQETTPRTVTVKIDCDDNSTT